MAKTCRTCIEAVAVLDCYYQDRLFCDSAELCLYHKKRETPLLVDALVGLVRKLSDPKTQGLEEATYAALIDEADYLLERYREEVGDAPEGLV